MRTRKSLVVVASGIAMAALFATMLPSEQAQAAKRKRGRGNLSASIT